MSDFKVASQVYLNQKLWERNCTPKEELQLTEIQLHPEVPSERRARKKPEAVHLFYILIQHWEDLHACLIPFSPPQPTYSVSRSRVVFFDPSKNATLGHKLRYVN